MGADWADFHRAGVLADVLTIRFVYIHDRGGYGGYALLPPSLSALPSLLSCPSLALSLALPQTSMPPPDPHTRSSYQRVTVASFVEV